MSDPYIGEIRIFAGNFSPYNWAYCSGSLQSIAQNSALFAILGTSYGGNGVSSFALPNLQGRAALHVGGEAATGPGLSTYFVGEATGIPSVTLLTTNIPAHTHPFSPAIASSPAQQTNEPNGNYRGVFPQIFDPSISMLATMSPQATTITGSTEAHENRQPYLAMTYIICLYGIFPPHA